jgi:hypothetical protein
MIKSVSEFVAEAKSKCNCLDADAAKVLYDQSDNVVIINVREPTDKIIIIPL